jgi:hypothetical protein
MNPRKAISIIIVLVLALIHLPGCRAAPIPITGAEPSLTATVDPYVLATEVSAAETRAVAFALFQLTATELARPTATLTSIPPTLTMTPTATNTLIIPTSTLTQTPTKTLVPLTPTPTLYPAYQCSIISVSPVKNQILKPREDFDFVVVLKNNGTKNWEIGQFDFLYVSGIKMQKYVDIIDIPKTVKPGEQIQLVIDMLAPDTTGSARAVWNLAAGKIIACSVTLDIIVRQ